MLGLSFLSIFTLEGKGARIWGTRAEAATAVLRLITGDGNAHKFS